MCIRDRNKSIYQFIIHTFDRLVCKDNNRRILNLKNIFHIICLLYTSDAADERSSVDLGGRRIIKKKNNQHMVGSSDSTKNNKYTRYIKRIIEI